MEMNNEMIFCQSCGMPMESAEMKGTEKDGGKSDDYCVYCYKDGAFGNPDETMEDMIETCVPHMQGMTPDEARKQMREFFPTLKRWKQA